MKRSKYVNEKNESEGRSAKKRALRRFGEFKLAKRGKEGEKLGIWERCKVIGCIPPTLKEKLMN